MKTLLALTLSIAFCVVLNSQSISDCALHDAQTTTADNTNTKEYQLSLMLEQEVQESTCNYSIPIVFHVLHYAEETTPEDGTSNPTDAWILGTLDHLNWSFQQGNDNPNCSITFCTSFFDDDNQVLASPGINRIAIKQEWITTVLFGERAINHSTLKNTIMPEEIYDPNKYLNVWLIPLYHYRGISFINGESFFPQYPNLEGIDTGTRISAQYQSTSTKDGVVIRTGVQANNPALISHETGHWLGLLHTFGVFNSCGNDDYCEDTGLCDASSNRCTDNQSCGTPDPIDNFMHYSSCQETFTPCQFGRFESTFTWDPMRNNVINHTYLCDPNTWLTAQVYKEYDVFCPGDEVHLKSFFDVFVPDTWTVHYSYSLDGGLSWSLPSTDAIVHAILPEEEVLVHITAYSNTGDYHDLGQFTITIYTISDCDWGEPGGEVPYEEVSPLQVEGIAIGYPNPTSDIVRLYSEYEIVEVRAVDMNYNSVYAYNADEIDVSNLATGVIYLHIVFSNDSFEVIQILKI